MPQEHIHAWWSTWWPWAEANQGLLSVGALFAALVVAGIEQRRANRADTAQAAALVRAEGQSREERAAADERSANEARQADDRMFGAILNERTSRIAEYVTAAERIISPFRIAARAEIARLEALEGDAPHASVAGPLIAAGREAHDALEALLVAVPADPELILATRQAIASLGTADNMGMAFGKAVAIRSVQTRLEVALSASLRLTERLSDARAEHVRDLARE